MQKFVMLKWNQKGLMPGEVMSQGAGEEKAENARLVSLVLNSTQP